MYKGFIPWYIHIHNLIYYLEDTSFSQDKDTTHHFFHKMQDMTHHFSGSFTRTTDKSKSPISTMVSCKYSLYGIDIIDFGAFDFTNDGRRPLVITWLLKLQRQSDPS